MDLKKFVLEGNPVCRKEAVIVGDHFRIMNRSPSSRQLKKYKFFLPVEIYLLAVLCSLQVNFVFFHWC